MADPGLSDAGLVVPRTADFLDRIRSTYEGNTQLAPDWDSDLILGQFSAIMAQELGLLGELVQAVYDAFDANGASGVQLTNIAQLVGVLRQKATYAEVPVTLTGTPGTIIVAGKLAEGGGSDGRARWALTEDVTIGASGSAETTLRAVEAGRTVALTGEVDTIATPVPGWDSVTNTAGSSPGANAESDSELRARRARSIQTAGGVGVPSLRARVLALDFIEAAAVIDNPDNEENTVEGVPLPASSLLVIVMPNTLTDAQKATLHRLIYANAPGGIAIAGDEAATVTGADGFDKTTAFSFAEEIPAHIEISPALAAGYSAADARAKLDALVKEHIETLTLGDALRRLQIAALAAQVPGITGIGTLRINGSTDDLVVTALQRIIYGSLGPA